MTCWKVGRFVQRIVAGRKPENWIRSAFALACHTVGSEPCVAASVFPAASSACQSEAAHAERLPAPQYAVEKGPFTGRPSSVRRSLSTYEYQPAPYELPPEL